jgi:hypothetical protein
MATIPKMSTDRFQIPGVGMTSPWANSSPSIFYETCLEGIIKSNPQSIFSNSASIIIECLRTIETKYECDCAYFTVNEYPDKSDSWMLKYDVTKWVYWMIHEQLQIAILNYYLKKKTISYAQEVEEEARKRIAQRKIEQEKRQFEIDVIKKMQELLKESSIKD